MLPRRLYTGTYQPCLIDVLTPVTPFDDLCRGASRSNRERLSLGSYDAGSPGTLKNVPWANNTPACLAQTFLSLSTDPCRRSRRFIHAVDIAFARSTAIISNHSLLCLCIFFCLCLLLSSAGAGVVSGANFAPSAFSLAPYDVYVMSLCI